MKRHLFFIIFAFASVQLFAVVKSEKWLQKAIKTSEQKLLHAAMQLKDSAKCPRTYEHNRVRLVTGRDWTSGFFPGCLWYAYQLTGNEQLKSEAMRFTEFVENAKFRTNTHDLGFILNCSFGNGLKITQNPHYKDVLITGATTLIKRYNPHVGLIKSWDKIVGPWEFPVIIDNMMNLEMLYEVGLMTNNKFLLNACISHADNTLKNHFRPDNSCFHVVNYDTINNKLISRETHQGYSHSSSWARGQAWALYGFTMMYRYTKKTEYLQHAEKVASFIFSHPRLPKDLIPYWDFDAPGIPNEPRDASAAAVIASALLELADYSSQKATYTGQAEQILKTLSSDKYSSPKGENGHFLLMHSTGNKPFQSEIDVPIIYADYYYLEALYRWKNRKLKLRNE